MVLLGYGWFFRATAMSRTSRRETFQKCRLKAGALRARIRRCCAVSALRSGLQAVLEALRFHALLDGAAGEARAHLVVAALLRFGGQRLVLRGALAARGGAMLRF